MSSARALALLLIAPACAEDPSFVLRWQVGRAPDDVQDLASVRQCSALGLSHVRVITSHFASPDEGADNPEVVDDEREYSCFPDSFKDLAAMADGPEIDPGEYRVVVLGLTRRGISRADEDGTVLARAYHDITVAERGAGAPLDPFELLVGECHDGIDNDRDGAVDQADAPCRQGRDQESLDLSITLFTVQTTLLSGNPQASCDGLGLRKLRIHVDGGDVEPVEFPCTTAPVLISAEVPPGTYTWSVVGVGPGDTVVTEPLTGPVAGANTFTVEPFNQVQLVAIDVDLDLASFTADPAFDEPQRFAVEFEPYPDGVGRLCQPPPALGTLTLGDVQLTLLAAGADPDDPYVPVDTVTLPALDDAPLPAVAPCEFFQQIRQTSPIAWSAAGNARYRLQVEAYSPDDLLHQDPCFSNAAEPAELAPGADIALTLPRVRTDGACSDCPTGNECDRCEDGVCLP